MLDDGAVIAVKVSTERSMTVVGISAWDAARRTLCIGELYEDDMFSNLEGIIVATNAKEAIFCESDFSAFDKTKLVDVIEKCGVAMTMVKKQKFKSDDLPVDLERLAGSHVAITKYLDKKAGISATASLIGYLHLMADPSLEGIIKLQELGSTNYMQLDNAAVRALNILPFPGDGGKKGSLFGLLNRTKTSMGSRLLRRWISQPLQDIDEINSRLDVTAAFIAGAECCRGVRETHLKMMPDLNHLCKRFTKHQGAKANLQDVVRLYQCSIRLPFLCELLEDAENEKILGERYSVPLRKLVRELVNFEALVETTIDIDRIDNGEFVVNPSVDPELQTLRQQQDSILVDINDEHRKVAHAISGLKNDALKLERKDNLGYIFRLTRKEEKLIRGKSQYNVLETRKDGVRFQSRTLRRLSQAYESIATEYDGREFEMRTKVLEVVGTYVEVFLDVAAVLAEVDVASSFATAAVEARSAYCRPTLKLAGSGLVLKQARHPIVEENMDDGAEFIANDIDLTRIPDNAESDKEGGGLLIVTGPNMGGKSTYIRSAGVLTLMAHIGCFVPAEHAEVPITDRIFARVGAADNPNRAISTFMSEMLETAAILKSATHNSLVIIDELGRGTGTTDGYGLAYAISWHIAQKIRSACMFATHFFELTALSEDSPCVGNVHVSAVTDPNTNKLTFLYEVQRGACDQSFGVHVAEMARFPPKVVAEAKRKADELEGIGTAGKRVKMSNISDGDKKVGLGMVEEFLEKVKKLPLDTEEHKKSSLAQARDWRKRIVAEKNPYVMALLESS
ncbi:unnamed protein product [Chondrus crispus]|uniref:DNA mismatch repair proteins mutS family domain-containing protein n=1 Tax=Chondrus crispus TaxID=2769 RepID=R7QCI5_CHOCR|nr:unnamed protein product [Chondrus crispus]CDF35131.1 unnamed protein product [Chondrus crispus]|eukprot:XP_005714950.1 unnamed protein product [Chondrus crispus]